MGLAGPPFPGLEAFFLVLGAGWHAICSRGAPPSLWVWAWGEGIRAWYGPPGLWRGGAAGFTCRARERAKINQGSQVRTKSLGGPLG